MNKNQVFVQFDHGEGLYFEPGTESLFEMAGEDGHFYPAKAKIRKGQVVLTCWEVKEPVYVRFAWGNTSISNLYNASNLPASSFTTYRP